MIRTRVLICLDTTLFIALLLLQSPRGTGLSVHEWLGISFAATAGFHILLNWRWIVTTLARVRVPDARRARANAALNGGLFVTMTLVVLSGLMVSEVALPYLGLRPAPLRAWRDLHGVLAMIAVAFVGLHLALNGDWIAGVLRHRSWRRSGPNEPALDIPDDGGTEGAAADA